ncbi:MAG: His-Xaa-Ser system radical SAM maturase HxsC [Acidobacteriota bacterium]
MCEERLFYASYKGEPEACVAQLSTPAASELRSGDVVLILPDGPITVVWEAGTIHNCILVTNTCNCRCVMCPQPPRRDAPDQLNLNLEILRLAAGESVASIALSGGEPTLRLDWLCMLIHACKTRFPEAESYLLTNGIAFHQLEVCRRIVATDHPRLTLCISLLSDVDRIHDEITGVTGGFNQTVAGLHNLALLKQKVEVRVVVLRENYQRLPQLAEFIYRNFPFAIHVAFMGVEVTGLARLNVERVWIDPVLYVSQLKLAVQHLSRRDLRVSIYNLPLCLLPEELRPFARDSISGWKKAFLPLCEGCVVRASCPGLFATSNRYSDRLSPVTD